jgi:SNF2 family DNA or RNA helicase
MRWSLSGTLIHNSLDDAFVHLNFTGISPIQEWDEFRDRISRYQRQQPALAARRLQAFLKTCMLRRTKDTQLNGKPILTLPEKTIQVVDLQFTTEERDIYTAVEMKMRVRFNKFMAKGTVMKNYTQILVMLMRLRQLCNHPYLLTRRPGEQRSDDDIEVDDADLFLDTTGDAAMKDNEAELARAERVCGADYVEKIKRKLKERVDEMVQAEVDGTEGGDDDCVCSSNFLKACR